MRLWYSRALRRRRGGISWIKCNDDGRRHAGDTWRDAGSEPDGRKTPRYSIGGSRGGRHWDGAFFHHGVAPGPKGGPRGGGLYNSAGVIFSVIPWVVRQPPLGLVWVPSLLGGWVGA